jgi:hypothetical protein
MIIKTQHKRKFSILIIVYEILVLFVYTVYILPAITSHPFAQDFAQDYIGGKALLSNDDELYPILGPALAKIGIAWDITHRSTHPPSAFLLALPFTIFNYRFSVFLWMVAMFSCLFFASHVLGLTWRKSLLVSLISLAWPPTIWSLYQYTPIWMIGLVFAYRYRSRPLKSGIWIAIASLPKFIPAIILFFYVRFQKWKGLLGFGSLWVGTFIVLLLLRKDVIASYLTNNNFDNLINQINRQDNGALLIIAWRLGRYAGVIIGIIIIFLIFRIGIQGRSSHNWACLVWSGVTLLPIAWNYSLLPLLPWLLLTLRKKSISVRMLAIASLLTPYFGPLVAQNPWSVALCIMLSGLTFTLASLVDKKGNKLKIKDSTKNWRLIQYIQIIESKRQERFIVFYRTR